MNALALNPYVFEFLGTLVLVLFGDGVCAACSLNKSKAKGGGWVVIALAWGLAVGFWSSLDEIKAQWQAEHVFTPSGTDTAALKAGWADAISRTLTK